MLRVLALSLTLVSLAPSSPAAAWAGASPQDGSAEPRALLEAAAAAAAQVKTATYKARSAVVAGSNPAGSVAGEVRFSALEPADELGSMLYIKASAPDASGAEIPFKLTYDGTLVRGQIGEEKVIWFSSLDDAGGELLEVGRQLMMDQLFSQAPFADALATGKLSIGSEIQVGGVACREVVVEFGELKRNAKITWALGVEDSLPRRRVGQVHRRGVFQTETLEIVDLKPNVGIHPSVYKLPVPTGFEAKPFVSNQPKTDLLEEGSEAPEITLRESGGDEFKLSAKRGKVIVLDFWATWCPPCRQAMPVVQRIHERFKDNDRVEVWGVATQERAGSDPKGFMEQGGFTYGLLLNGERVSTAYKVALLPTFYVLGTDGQVLHASLGFDPLLDKKIGDLIESHLK